MLESQSLDDIRLALGILKETPLELSKELETVLWNLWSKYTNQWETEDQREIFDLLNHIVRKYKNLYVKTRDVKG